MSEAKYTPGPWGEPKKSGDGKRIFIEQDADGWHSLRVEVDSDDCDSDTAMANAKLIVAAPDLLEACQLVSNASAGTCDASNIDFSKMEPAMMAVEEAIKKATT